jgi:hypothetical protein
MINIAQAANEIVEGKLKESSAMPNPEEPSQDDAENAAVQSMMDAFHSRDHQGVKDAFRSLLELHRRD